VKHECIEKVLKNVSNHIKCQFLQHFCQTFAKAQIESAQTMQKAHNFGALIWCKDFDKQKIFNEKKWHFLVSKTVKPELTTTSEYRHLSTARSHLKLL
jgi:hypothetical protein